MNKKLLVTGGAGYIGTHTIIELIANGFSPVVMDNLSNSTEAALARVERLVGCHIPFVKGDVTSASELNAIFQHAIDIGEPFDTVVHFAGLKSVGESVSEPLNYYQNNVVGTLELLKAMDAHGVRRIIFSSSATVYGVPQYLPYNENHPIGPTNPYGWTKAIAEQILKDWAATGDGRVVVSLRYFNPIGAHQSGTIGEDPRDTPNNLFPYITQVAVGRLQQLSIFGDDYETADGTGVRDYVHVVDLAIGHVKAVEFAQHNEDFTTFNLGTGKGTSVLELVRAFESATGRQVPYTIRPRRSGDIAEAYACVDQAQQKLGWQAQKSVLDMCIDGWRWQSSNPTGYL